MSRQPSNTLILSDFITDFTPFKPFFRVIPLEKFRICIFVYESTKAAKSKFDSLQSQFPLHYYLYTDLNWFSGSKIVPTEFLSPPKTEKNFLISPPGDPPLGWIQDPEAKPSPGGFTIAEEEGRHHFIKTRSFADLLDFKLDPDESPSHLQEIVTFTDGGEVSSLPLIVIDHAQDYTPLEPSRFKIPQTHMPPRA